MLKKAKIKYVGFDLDQTLYQDTKETHEAWRGTLYSLLEQELGISFQEAKKEFIKHYGVLGSGTEAVRVMGVKDPEGFSAKVSDGAKMHLYLKRNERLISLMDYLGEKYELFLVTASSRESARLKLEKLGVGVSRFKYAVYIDSKGAGKTTGRSFSRIIKMTKGKPWEHVYAGDREATDIVPAKKAGMQTIMVWGKSGKADLSIKTIYELENYL